MTCELVQRELEDFLYGELPAPQAGEVRAHLAVCVACQEAWMRLEAEDAAFALFSEQAAIEPSGEMWMAIRERISHEPVPARHTVQAGCWISHWWSRSGEGLSLVVLWQGAFALLLIMLSVLGTLYVVRRGGAREVATVLPSPPALVSAMAAPTPGIAPAMRVSPRAVRRLNDDDLSDEELIRQQIARAEREYQDAVRLLDQAIARRRDSLDPALMQQYESSLALIDSSIRQSRAALRGDANDPRAGQFLLAAYARKVELMRDIAMP